jgi:phytoene/squalene synthetase
MLDSKFHDSIYAIYGFVRVADEIVDTFHQHDKEKLFRRFCEDTYLALDNGISTNPILNSFQDTVNKFKIDRKLIDAFLKSMEMDLSFSKYEESSYEEYIYGSAEVVGLMCLKVFCQGDEKNYEKLVAPARSLGSAFQKINFLRDFKSDFAERGRVYFPGIDFNNFTNDQKKEIEKEIEKEFNDAWKGVIKLPNGSKLGVSVAYIYYVTLFKKIRRIPANKIKSERIRINNIQKIILLIQTWFRYNLRLI